MAEEDDFMEGAVGDDQEMAVGQKVGFLPAIAIKALKWLAAIIVGGIFIVTVVVVTLQIMGRGKESKTYIETSKAYEGKPPILTWFKNIDQIRGRTADENPNYVTLTVEIGYKMNKALQSELIDRTSRLKDLIRSYFSSKTVEELNNEERVKEELKNKINDIMRSGYIEEVIFTEFSIIPQ